MTPDTALEPQTNTPAQPQPVETTTETTTETTPPEVVPLPHVLRQIRRDARDNPQQYLDETRVRAGGE